MRNKKIIKREEVIMKKVMSYVLSVILIFSMCLYSGNGMTMHQIKADDINSAEQVMLQMTER